MKKIILAFDGTNFSESAFQFAAQLNKLSPLLLTGVFVPQTSYANLWSYSSAMIGTTPVPMIEELEGDAVEKNIERFEMLCKEQNIKYSVHKDFYDFALPELKRETAFADVLLISSESFYGNIGAEGPNDYMADLLHSSECPVIIVPEAFRFPDLTILAYDGKASSVYAVKQFAYLFPELASNKTILTYSDEDAGTDLPNQELIRELADQHFPDLHVAALSIDPKKYFSTWISEKGNAILVCGSYGRSAISQLFRKSFVADVIAEHKLPVFIAHK
jgi:hypothetical protein